MEFEAESILDHPQVVVYQTYRDHLPELVENVRNIERIDVHQRDEIEGGIKLHNIWRADARIPRIAQAVISQELMTWDDFALWRDQQHVCDWELVPHKHPERFVCTGHHSFERVDNNRTRVRIEGDLELNLEALNVVPKGVRASVQDKIEEWITSLMVKSLLQINEALDEYIREES